MVTAYGYMVTYMVTVYKALTLSTMPITKKKYFYSPIKTLITPIFLQYTLYLPTEIQTKIIITLQNYHGRSLAHIMHLT